MSGPRAVLAGHLGMTEAALLEYDERMRRDMLEFACAVTEGFCPRCKCRLIQDDWGTLCPSCDCYPSVGYRNGELYGTSFASGWWKRGEVFD